VRQTGRIFVSHSMQVIDCPETLPAPLAGGLAPWQETRAKALMTIHLGHDITLAFLASECKLSVSHFARSFKQSTGKPPHRWLLESRVEKAKELLMGTDLPLAQTALACGFADQSHFTRVFSRTVGTSPGTWRRLRLNQQITERVIFGNEMADAGADITEMTQIPEFPSYRNSAL
jgi:AraC-like DNA-binding protein